MPESKMPLELLLIEDDEDDALLIVEELRDGGYAPAVTRAWSRATMHQALACHAFDVIICDHKLPGFSAIDALLLLLESRQDILFIIVSGTIGEELAVEAMKSGAHDFIMKHSLARLPPAVANGLLSRDMRRSAAAAQVEVRASRERLRELSSHLESVREQERARLAREIHDELGGLLTGLKMDIAWLGRRTGAIPDVGAKLQAMTRLTDDAIRTVRRIITDLRPSLLDDLGLIAAVEWQWSEFRQRMGMRGTLALGVEPNVTTLLFDERTAVAAFRILQESLTNIARHAEAERVDVRVAVEDGALVLEITDDGIGMNSGQRNKSGAYGILGMVERARHLGGELSVDSSPGQGTRVRLRLPMGTGQEEAG